MHSKVYKTALSGVGVASAAGLILINDSDGRNRRYAMLCRGRTAAEA